MSVMEELTKGNHTFCFLFLERNTNKHAHTTHATPTLSLEQLISFVVPTVRGYCMYDCFVCDSGEKSFQRKEKKKKVDAIHKVSSRLLALLLARFFGSVRIGSP